MSCSARGGERFLPESGRRDSTFSGSNLTDSIQEQGYSKKESFNNSCQKKAGIEADEFYLQGTLRLSKLRMVARNDNRHLALYLFSFQVKNQLAERTPMDPLEFFRQLDTNGCLPVAQDL